MAAMEQVAHRACRPPVRQRLGKGGAAARKARSADRFSGKGGAAARKARSADRFSAAWLRAGPEPALRTRRTARETAAPQTA